MHTKGRNSQIHRKEIVFKKTLAQELIHLVEAIDNSYWESKLEDTLTDHT